MSNHSQALNDLADHIADVTKGGNLEIRDKVAWYVSPGRRRALDYTLSRYIDNQKADEIRTEFARLIAAEVDNMVHAPSQDAYTQEDKSQLAHSLRRIAEDLIEGNCLTIAEELIRAFQTLKRIVRRLIF